MGMLQRSLIGLVRAYQVAISPWTPASCRYVPTCSEYAREAIETHGAGRGTWLAARRLLRCHPFAGSGYDPVPPKADRGSRHDPMVQDGGGEDVGFVGGAVTGGTDR